MVLGSLGIRTVCDVELTRNAKLNPRAGRDRILPRSFYCLAARLRAMRGLWAKRCPLGQARTKWPQPSARRPMTPTCAPPMSGSSWRLGRNLVFRHKRILNGSGPTLFHCTAGKDRTGVFSALLLLLLGVPRETVFEDYLLTNTYLEAERLAAMVSALKDPTGTTSLMLADRSYLETALQTIDRKFGSLDNYRRTELGLSDRILERLKARLLE